MEMSIMFGSTIVSRLQRLTKARRRETISPRLTAKKVTIGAFGGAILLAAALAACTTVFPVHHASAAQQTCGSLHTDGAQIKNAEGQTVVLTGVNWFGFETQSFAPQGL